MSERDGERVLEENRRLSKQADALAAEAKRQRADLQAKAADLQASTDPPPSLPHPADQPSSRQTPSKRLRQSL